MSGYVTVNRFSLVQLYSEERKHRAHLKKISDMQRRSGLDNNPPTYFPVLKNTLPKQAKERHKEIARENELKSKRILEIMQSKSKEIPPPPPCRPPIPTRRYQSLNLSQNNAEYLQRIAKTKGTYDVREWNKEFEEHKEHLKLSKDNKLFTPRDVGINRQRIIKASSTINSRRTTPISSVIFTSRESSNND